MKTILSVLIVLFVGLTFVPDADAWCRGRRGITQVNVGGIAQINVGRRGFRRRGVQVNVGGFVAPQAVFFRQPLLFAPGVQTLGFRQSVFGGFGVQSFNRGFGVQRVVVPRVQAIGFNRGFGVQQFGVPRGGCSSFFSF